MKCRRYIQSLENSRLRALASLEGDPDAFKASPISLALKRSSQCENAPELLQHESRFVAVQENTMWLIEVIMCCGYRDNGFPQEG